jgi:methionyl aminopeptidase
MNKDYISHFIKAGALAKEVRLFGRSLIKKGASYQSVFHQINQKIFELGAIPAFPPQMSLNEVAAHFLLEPDQDLIFSNELIKLDVGVCYEGAIGDTAVTIDLSGRFTPLIEATETALLEAEKIIAVGLPIKEIGKVIEKTIRSFGFSPVKNLAGHGLGPYKIHTFPQIPNIEDNSKGRVKAGMSFAIEPFATNGKGLVYEEGEATLFAFERNGPLKTRLANTLFEKIKTFKGLPFSLHQLIQESLSLEMVKKGVRELLKEGVLVEYPPLIEETGGYVAQAENSILVDLEGQVIVTTR